MKFDNKKFNMQLALHQISIKELCEKSGLGVTTLRKARKGQCSPRPATIGKIAKALGVDVKDIIQDED